ncbi:hypothetical protein [Hyphococcus sp.]|uniref:hypothetical protein n=1 Tax=Hyphococcus sp. TaxID=2038636 RepID=UPI003CCB768E
MLLRRITEHVKAQNWTAVALDFIIVVVGVFIGIQVANWNDARRERASEATYLKSLQTDIAVSTRLLNEHVAHIGDRQQALAILANAGKDAIARRAFDDLVRVGLYELQFLNVQRNTYQALENAGRIGVLQDLTLQQSLVDQSVQIAAIREYEADMARFQHRWVDEFLLTDYHIANMVDFEAAGAKPRRDDATDYPALMDEKRIRNLSAFLYDILDEQRAHAETLREAYAASAVQTRSRLETLGENE